MDVEMVFNELSGQPPAANIHDAMKRMSIFIGTTVMATGRFRVKRVLRVEKVFLSMELAPGYPLSKWRNDKQVDREERRYFNNLKTKYPVLTDFESSELKEQYIPSEYIYNGKTAHGLSIAYLLNALALSLNLDSKWDKSQWNSNQLFLQISQKQSVTVHHASHPAHVKANADWIREQLEKDDPWLKHGLPRNGEYPYQSPKRYYAEKLEDFPKESIEDRKKGFLDHKKQIWLWHKEEAHWDVQFQPYGEGRYLRVTPDGHLLNK
ncbi:MAG: hypothetical protein B6245_08455 [Desulfobacteraceae bacterium 4572_88]|nr:MAG: hypothetical protein B6245_08455 [Desulfobacteraceae bacterium 4572_88]